MFLRGQLSRCGCEQNSSRYWDIDANQEIDCQILKLVRYSSSTALRPFRSSHRFEHFFSLLPRPISSYEIVSSNHFILKMRASLLLSSLLAIAHTTFGSPIPDPDNSTITIDLEDPDIDYPILPQKQKLGGGDGFISGTSNYGAMQRQNGAWQSSHGFPFSATDKLFIMRYQVRHHLSRSHPP